MTKKQPMSEAERAQRIREAQLAQRDPGVSKIKGYDWSKHAQRSAQIKKSRQKPLLVDVFEVLPGRWKGAAAGTVVGLVPLAAALIFLKGEWVILGVVGLLICAIVGFVIGSTTQNRIERW